jgi:hypothetical protein
VLKIIAPHKIELLRREREKQKRLKSTNLLSYIKVHSIGTKIQYIIFCFLALGVLVAAAGDVGLLYTLVH